MNLEQQVVELEKSIQTITEAHHTALEAERQKKDYFNQDNQRLKAELERACGKLEVERKKVRELEAELSQSQQMFEELRQRFPTTAQIMVYESLLQKYHNLEAQLAPKCASIAREALNGGEK